jgi:hypothetical protein
MKPVIDIYLRRVVYNIRTIEYGVHLPRSAAHFHNIPGQGSKLYVHNNRLLYIKESGVASEILLYV